MSFLQNLFKAKDATPAFQPPAVPVQLPNLTMQTAAEMAQAAEPGEAAKQLLTPQQTPSQYLAALQEKHLGGEMVKAMAHGMPDRSGVMWAVLSAQKVKEHLPSEELQAIQAAHDWVKNPNPNTAAAAAAAAAKTDMMGPGALAAQGAAWTQPASPVAAGAEGAPPPSRLTPHAVAGAVQLAAAIAADPKAAAPKLLAAVAQAAIPELPKPAAPAMPAAPDMPAAPALTIPPAIQEHMFKSQHPFIAMGLDIASGKTPVG